MLYPVRRYPLCASLWLSVPLFCLWWYSYTLVQFGRLYGRFMAFCRVCRLCICRCALLCGSVAAFYGVGVLFIGYGLKIALRGKYGRSTGCGVSRLCCACGILCRCAALWGLWCVLWRYDGRNKAPASCTGAREKPGFLRACSLIYSFSAVRKR